MKLARRLVNLARPFSPILRVINYSGMTCTGVVGEQGRRRQGDTRGERARGRREKSGREKSGLSVYISKGYRLERIICFRRDTFVNFVTRVWL